MIRRQTRREIDAQDIRERALLVGMTSPRAWIVQAVVGTAVLVAVVVIIGFFR